MTDVKQRTSKEIEKDQGTLIAECEKLEAKSRTEAGLTPEEVKLYDEYLTQGERLKTELADAYRSERLAEMKERANLPTRPAVAVAGMYAGEQSAPKQH